MDNKKQKETENKFKSAEDYLQGMVNVILDDSIFGWRVHYNKFTDALDLDISIQFTRRNAITIQELFDSNMDRYKLIKTYILRSIQEIDQRITQHLIERNN